MQEKKEEIKQTSIKNKKIVNIFKSSKLILIFKLALRIDMCAV
jgi:hypothetical protein